MRSVGQILSNTMTIGLLLDCDVVDLLQGEHILLEVNFMVSEFEVLKCSHNRLIL